MKLFNILTKGDRIDSFYEILFYNYISNVAPTIHEYTGFLPYTFTSDGNDAIIDISGNTTQTGIPTPSNPVDVQGVGTLDNGQYIIPLTSGGVTTNIELGDTQAVRQIYKYVLTGNETYTYDSAYTRFNFSANGLKFEGIRLTPLICTHYEVVDDGRTVGNVPNNAIYAGGSVSAPSLYIKTDAYTTETDFKQYLATQYANGTPVTIWYVLATPETGTVNEPLMKIGDYVDTISGISLPTTVGTNTILCSTTVQPSEVYIRYTGG